MSLALRKSLIDVGDTELSQRKQCELLGLSRSTLYYVENIPGKEDLELMKAIDKEYLRNPFYGRRRMTLEMRDQGFFVGEKKVRTAMKRMGLEAIYPKPNLSKPHQEHKKYPYLMRSLKVDRSDQAWAADITYIPLQGGFALRGSCLACVLQCW